MQFSPKSIWQSTPKEMQEYYKETFSGFFLRDEEFVSRTINDSNIDLDKFSASKVRHLVKKLESSKSTAKYIKQVSNEPQATQVNLLRHQCTELPPNKYQRKQRIFKPRSNNHKYQQEERKNDILPQESEKFKQKHNNQEERCHKCGDTPHIEGFRCHVSRHQCKHCSKIGHFSHLCFKKKQANTYKKGSRNPKAYQLQVGRYSTDDSLYISDDTDVSESEDSFCLQMQIKKP